MSSYKPYLETLSKKEIEGLAKALEKSLKEEVKTPAGRRRLKKAGFSVKV